MTAFDCPSVSEWMESQIYVRRSAVLTRVVVSSNAQAEDGHVSCLMEALDPMAGAQTHLQGGP